MPPQSHRTTTRKVAITAIALVLGMCLILASERLQGLLTNTALLVGGCWLVSLPVGTLLAVAIAKTNLPGRRLLECLFVAMLFVPLFVQCAAWQATIGQGGWLIPADQNWLVGWSGAIWVHGMAAIPWVVLFVGAALRNVPREWEEESLQDASAGHVLWSVTLRRSLASVVAAALWIGVMCAGEITVTDIFQIRTFAEEVYTTANLGSLQEVVAMEPGQPLVGRDLWFGTLFVVCLVVAALLAMSLWLPGFSLVSPTESTNWVATTPNLGTSFLVWCLALLVLATPLVGLLGKAGMNAYREGEQVHREWSAAKAANLTAVSPYEHRRELKWTALISGSAALLATAAGVLLAWLLRLRRVPVGPTALGLAICFALPGPLLGIWTIKVLNQPDDSALSLLTWLYDRTILAPVVVQMLRALPLATLVLTAHLATVPQSLLDSAVSEGASWWRRLLQIALPMRWHAVVAALCMSAIVGVSDLAATLLVCPPGVSTISVRIFGLLHYGAEDRVSAFCLMLTLVLGAAAILAWTLISRVRDE